jgi:septum formation protein
MSTNPFEVLSIPEVIILASTSPRRQELLRQIGVPFRCIKPSFDEQQVDHEAPVDFVLRMAREKARNVQIQSSSNREAVVLSADTIVVCDEIIMGKPLNRDNAINMLSTLSGKEHRVLTAVAVARGPDLAVLVSETLVEFKKIERAEFNRYWETGEPIDKAGGYAIQGLGGVFVKQIKGSYSGVVGLPLYETAMLLSRFGIRCWQVSREELEREG